MDPVAEFYSGSQIGHGMPVYSGSRRQMGGGLWSTIQRIALPIMRKIIPRFGKAAAQKLVNVGAHALTDALENRSGFVDAVRSHGSLAVRQTLADLMRQSGGSRRQRKRKAPARKRTKSVKRRKTTKRGGKGEGKWIF
jgi:hypothetical protein